MYSGARINRRGPGIFREPGWVEHDADEIWSTQAEITVEAMDILNRH